MIGDDDMEQCNEEYDELNETDVYNSDTNISFSKKRKETTQDRLLKWNSFYSNEKFGILVQCTKCKKWRKVFEYEEEHQVPTDWSCAMDLSGPKDCNEPECLDEDDFSPGRFVPGSIVWAKLAGYPWWPAMVEDDPDTEEYYWEDEEGKYYHVTFLDDKVTHAWVPEFSVLSFLKNPPKEHIKSYRIKYSHLIENAKKKANAAIAMPIKDRLNNFSFAKLYKGKWPLAKSFDNDKEDDIDLTKMLIKEVEEMDSINFTDSENEMDSSIEENNYDYKTNKIKKFNISDNNKGINLKHRKQKMNTFLPKNSNQKLGKKITYKDYHLAPQKTEDTSGNYMKKNNLIEGHTEETIPYKRKKNQNKSKHILSKINENKLLNSDSMKTGRKNMIMRIDQHKPNICPKKLTVTNKSYARWNKHEENTELKIKKGEGNNKLPNIKKIKRFVKDDVTEKRMQNVPIKSEFCKIPNSKNKQLKFQPPVKAITKTTSKEGKQKSLNNNSSDSTDTSILGSIQNEHNEDSVSEQDISDEEQSKLQEEKVKIENEQEIREEETRICLKNEAEKNIHNIKGGEKSQKFTGVSQSLNNSDSEDIILDSIANNHTENSVSEQTEDLSCEEKPKPGKIEIENKQKIKQQKVKISLKNKTEINIHNSKGKPKSHKLKGACIIQENISKDKTFIENSDGSKTQDKFNVKEITITKETNKSETKNAKGEKSVSSNDQILKILEQNISDSVGSTCNLNSATDKNCPNDSFNKPNSQNENIEFSGGIANNKENKANIKISSSGKNDSKLRQENTSNNKKQKKYEKKSMKGSKPNVSDINDKNGEPKETSNKKCENKKLNKQFLNSTKSNICKQGNITMNTKPNGQCNAKVSKDIEISNENGYLLSKQNHSEEKPKTNIPQGIRGKIKKISDKNPANKIEAEEKLITLNKFDKCEQENYSFSFEMNNEQNENEDSDPFEVE